MACPNFKNGPKTGLRPLGVNIMLQNICFRDEKELLSNQNAEHSYVYNAIFEAYFPI
jgi:hypothetical protein